MSCVLLFMYDYSISSYHFTPRGCVYLTEGFIPVDLNSEDNFSGSIMILPFHFLQDYRITHPNVTVLDPPDAIQHVYSRQSMLQVVAELNLTDPYGNLLLACYVYIRLCFHFELFSFLG